jgi:hypothetical protein
MGGAEETLKKEKIKNAGEAIRRGRKESIKA